MWVCVPAWSPRRAFLVGAAAFASEAGVPPQELPGRVFVADLDVDQPPANVGTLGERLKWPRLCVAPRIPHQGGAAPATVGVVPTPLLSVTVSGLPAPQGSKRHVGNGVMKESSAAVKPWRTAVVRAVKQAVARRRGQGPWAPLSGPLEAVMVFSLDRPKGHFGTGRNAGVVKASAPLRPEVYPDLDKLVRSTGDAIKTGGGYVDDSLVVTCRASKHYVTDHGRVPDVLDRQGAVIRLYRVEDTRAGAPSPVGGGT